MNQRNRLGADRVTAADVSESFTGFRFHADVCGRDLEAACQPPDHERCVRGQLRPFEADGCVNVHDLIAGVADEVTDALEKNKAGFVAPFRGGVWKMAADIAERGSAE